MFVILWNSKSINMIISVPSNQNAGYVLLGQSEPAHRKFANVMVYNHQVSFTTKVSI